MTAAINYLVVTYQLENINTRGDLDKFNASIHALKFTPNVDLALSIISTIGAIIALHMGVPLIGLLVLGAVFFISGASILKSKNSIDRTAAAVNQLWNLKFNQGL
jgi:hypothetical protein